MTSRAGERLKFHSGITLVQARSLQQLCARERPQETLEIGLAFGASALAILRGKGSVGSLGQHQAIDPFQSGQWHGAGVHAVERDGFGDRFKVVEELSHQALPRLETEGLRVDLAFVEGDHSREAATLDALLVDRILKPAGLVVFHDYPASGVWAAVRTLLATGRYTRVRADEIQRPVPRRLAAPVKRLVRTRSLEVPGALASTNLAVLRRAAG